MFLSFFYRCLCPLLTWQTKIAGIVDVILQVPNLIFSAKASPVPEKKETIKDTAATANEMQQAIKHEVHLEALEMREHYLPILIGSGVGFVILTLLLSLTICCCCKRKLKRRMKMAKETEKPPLEGEWCMLFVRQCKFVWPIFLPSWAEAN